MNQFNFSLRYPMLHSATTNGICSEDNSPGRCGSAASGDAASTAGSGRCSHSGSGRGRGVRADARRRRSLWAAAQALQQLRKARERRGGRRAWHLSRALFRFVHTVVDAPRRRLLLLRRLGQPGPCSK
ncbi:hypothetical protein PMAYCL1PPCAC_14070 [Pristionchus mayeri]|uniref:Uncharacterized protein n=1 Tax=Pristionchus mayeri TaxID=1317129 RepID=A0AAN4ZUW8_9BILA|nr:hypothetical protein PMAYCL1PPCAC_14070 [Pristionchus mayeri]